MRDLLVHDAADPSTCAQDCDTIHALAGPIVINGRRCGGGEVPALGQHDTAVRAEFGAARQCRELAP